MFRSGDRAVVTRPIAACRRPGGDLYVLQLTRGDSCAMLTAAICAGGGQPQEGSRCQAHVLVMEAADVGQGNHLACARWLDSAAVWRILPSPKPSAYAPHDSIAGKKR